VQIFHFPPPVSSATKHVADVIRENEERIQDELNSKKLAQLLIIFACIFDIWKGVKIWGGFQPDFLALERKHAAFGQYEANSEFSGYCSAMYLVFCGRRRIPRLRTSVVNDDEDLAGSSENVES